MILNEQISNRWGKKNLTIVNRDKDTGRIKDGSKKLGKLIDDLQSGKVFLEDLLAEQVNALKDILLGRKKWILLQKWYTEDINRITSDLIQLSLCNQQCFPCISAQDNNIREVSISGNKSLSVVH